MAGPHRSNWITHRYRKTLTKKDKKFPRHARRAVLASGLGILTLLTFFALPMLQAEAQSPIRTGIIQRLCGSRYSYSLRLQSICQRQQAKAVQEFMELYGRAPYLSKAREHLKNCLIENYQQGLGYDWIAVVRCGGLGA